MVRSLSPRRAGRLSWAGRRGANRLWQGWECCGLRGTLALFGQSSGTVPAFEPGRLAKNGVFLTRPSLGHYTHTREELLDRARELFEWIGSGRLTLRIDREVPLRDVAEAHRALEARETTGKVLLIP